VRAPGHSEIGENSSDLCSSLVFYFSVWGIRALFGVEKSNKATL